MSHDGKTERDLVLVPLSTLRELEDGLAQMIDHFDTVVRLRPELLRLQRLVKEIDPDKTSPRGYNSPESEKAYKVSQARPRPDRINSGADSITFGPRFDKSKK